MVQWKLAGSRSERRSALDHWIKVCADVGQMFVVLLSFYAEFLFL